MVPECSWYIACFVDVSRKIPACIDCSNAGITVSVVRQARCLQQQRNWGTPHMYHSNWRFYMISINYFPIHIYSFIYCWGVLDDQKVWGDDGSMPGIAYIDSQDVSRMMASAMIKDRLPGKAQDIVSPLCYNSIPYYCAHIINLISYLHVYIVDGMQDEATHSNDIRPQRVFPLPRSAPWVRRWLWRVPRFGPPMTWSNSARRGQGLENIWDSLGKWILFIYIIIYI